MCEILTFLVSIHIFGLPLPTRRSISTESRLCDWRGFWDSAAILVAGLKGGEARAQQASWDRYWPEVYAICAQILGGGADATDTAVDLLTDFMVDYVNRLSHPRALRSYLRLMAVRRSLRRREKRSVMEYVDTDRLGDEQAVDPEEAAGYAVLAPRLLLVLISPCSVEPPMK